MFHGQRTYHIRIRLIIALFPTCLRSLRFGKFKVLPNKIYLFYLSKNAKYHRSFYIKTNDSRGQHDRTKHRTEENRS